MLAGELPAKSCRHRSFVNGKEDLLSPFCRQLRVVDKKTQFSRVDPALHIHIGTSDISEAIINNNIFSVAVWWKRPIDGFSSIAREPSHRESRAERFADLSLHLIQGHLVGAAACGEVFVLSLMPFAEDNANMNAFVSRSEELANDLRDIEIGGDDLNAVFGFADSSEKSSFLRAFLYASKRVGAGLILTEKNGGAGARFCRSVSQALGVFLHSLPAVC